MSNLLGESLRVYGWSCRGAIPAEGLKLRIQALVHYCGMTPVNEPMVWAYPLNGKGGVGETLFLPFGEEDKVLSRWDRWLLKFLVRRFRWAFIAFQPFTESFVVIDTYPEHDKISIVLATCLKPPDDLSLMVGKLFGRIFRAGKFTL